MHAVRPIAAPFPASPLPRSLFSCSLAPCFPAPSLPAFLLPVGYSLFPVRHRRTFFLLPVGYSLFPARAPHPLCSEKPGCETVKLWTAGNLPAISRKQTSTKCPSQKHRNCETVDPAATCSICIASPQAPHSLTDSAFFPAWPQAQAHKQPQLAAAESFPPDSQPADCTVFN